MKREDEIDRREIIRKNRQRLRASHQRRKLARIEDVESRRRDYEKSVKGGYNASLEVWYLEAKLESSFPDLIFLRKLRSCAGESCAISRKIHKMAHFFYLYEKLP